MSSETKKYRFGEEEIEAPVGMDVKDVQAVWSESIPALENAEYTTLEDGSVEFHVRAGTKG